MAQSVKNLPAMQETWVRSLGGKDPLEKEMATCSSILGLPWWLRCKESACNVGDPGSIPGWERSPGGGHGNPLLHFLPGKSHGQKSLVGNSAWGGKELDMTEQLSTCSNHLY